ncbi:MAG: alpha/beta fold hydrolase [Rhizobiaceae bacterium]|nr:alpha/beta fold hydrolase [Rhizobiaceae bacterium]
MKLKKTGTAAVLFATMLAIGTAQSHAQDRKPFSVIDQGSFYVGGTMVRAGGTYDPSKEIDKGNKLGVVAGRSDDGSTFWKDQMYVQYQIPENPRKYPLVFVHGGAGTGAVWESTADGREGYQTIFVRRGYPVYIVDAPRRGRSGFPTFNGPFGTLEGKEVISNETRRVGLEYAWSRWRIGPKPGEVFPNQAMPADDDSVQQFMLHVVPDLERDPDVVVDDIVKLLEKIGPAILVTHSEAGTYGWMAAMRSPNVAGIISFEPSYMFPKDEMPEPIPLYKGESRVGVPVTAEQFASLTKMPIDVFYGDNIPDQPVPDLLADGRRADRTISHLFVKALNDKGGDASVVELPKMGITGNSHFMFADKNNERIADEMEAFLGAKGLDAR